jgi:hypothetical protein
MSTVIVVTVQHRVEYQLHLIFVSHHAMNMHLLRCLALSQGRGIRALDVFVHEIPHEVLPETVKRTSRHVLLLFSHVFLLSTQKVQRVMDRFLYKLRLNPRASSLLLAAGRVH